MLRDDILHDHALEAGVLRYVMERPMTASRLGDLRPRDMTGEDRPLMLRAILELVQAGERPDAGAVSALMRKRGRAAAPREIAHFMREAPKGTGLDHAIPLLLDLSARRRLREPLLRLAAQATDGDLADVRASVRALATSVDAEDAEDAGSTSYTGAEMMMAVFDEVKARAERPAIDLGPMRALAREILPGSMVTIGGRSGSGKSQLAMLLGRRRYAATGSRVGIVSVEDRAHVWGDRAIAYEEGVSLLSGRQREADDFNDDEPRAAITSNDMEAAFEAIERTKRDDPYHLEVMDRSDVSDVERAMLRCIRAGAGMLVVDYVQEIRDRSSRSRNKTDEISDIAGRIKMVAKRARVPLILCSQLSRPARGTNPEPSMTDLKGSGDLENMSEGIVLLWKEHEDSYNSLAKISKLKSGSERPRLELVRNPGGMITKFERVKPKTGGGWD